MIGSVRGRIASKTPPQVMVDVGGVGYELEAPMSTFFHLPAVGEEVRLLTHLVVREDAHVLYAFATEEERRLFRSLIRVSGVGPKIALGLLSGMTVAAFTRCVQSEDVAALPARKKRQSSGPSARAASRNTSARRRSKPSSRSSSAPPAGAARRSITS